MATHAITASQQHESTHARHAPARDPDPAAIAYRDAKAAMAEARSGRDYWAARRAADKARAAWVAAGCPEGF